MLGCFPRIRIPPTGIPNASTFLGTFTAKYTIIHRSKDWRGYKPRQRYILGNVRIPLSTYLKPSSNCVPLSISSDYRDLSRGSVWEVAGGASNNVPKPLTVIVSPSTSSSSIPLPRGFSSTKVLTKNCKASPSSPLVCALFVTLDVMSFPFSSCTVMKQTRCYQGYPIPVCTIRVYHFW